MSAVISRPLSRVLSVSKKKKLIERDTEERGPKERAETLKTDFGGSQNEKIEGFSRGGTGFHQGCMRRAKMRGGERELSEMITRA